MSSAVEDIDRRMLRARDVMDHRFAEPLDIPMLAGVEITEEPVDQSYGIDFGLRDPFGNHVRIAQLKQA